VLRSWPAIAAAVGILCATGLAAAQGTLPVVRPGLIREAAEPWLQMSIDSLARRVFAESDLRIRFPRRHRVGRFTTPVRLITLHGGDQVLAEVTDWDTRGATFRLAGGQEILVPREAIESVRTPPGERDVLYEPFESIPGGTNEVVPADWLDEKQSAAGRSSLRLIDQRGTVSIPLPEQTAALRFQIWIRADQTARMRVRFEADTEEWSVVGQGEDVCLESRGGSGEAITTQRVPLHPGWHRLTVCLTDDHAFAAWDQALLGSAPRGCGPVRKIHLSAASEVWFDELQVSRLDVDSGVEGVPDTTSDDCLTRSDGNQWLGRLQRVDASTVAFLGLQGTRTVPWSEVDRIDLHSPAEPVAGPIRVDGWWASLELQPTVEHPHVIPRIYAAITSVDRYGVAIHHPWLGSLYLAWPDILGIQLDFAGRMIVVDGRTRHLGDAIRSDFRRPVPDATVWKSSLDLEAHDLDSGSARLTLNVAELEPASDQTPPGSPYLQELRAGGLRTDVYVNQQLVGDLNSQIRFRARVGEASQIRMPIPRAALRSGTNEIELKQRPLNESRNVYDNCEISNMRLEFVSGSR